VAASVLGHALLADARSAQGRGRCYRELPVTWRTPDGALIEGTVDLAFESGAQMTVLDFKTDREVADDLDRYRRQLSIYCRALAAARSIPTRGVLLRV
jgi:ATP-dependent exoDNAse (exonuclease V) beta subunit